MSVDGQAIATSLKDMIGYNCCRFRYAVFLLEGAELKFMKESWDKINLRPKSTTGIFLSPET